MKSNTEKVKNQLNSLIQSTHDAIDGFRTAAENVNDQKIVDYFIGRMNERKVFLEDLKQELIDLGEEYNETGSVGGVVHRVWMDIKATFSSNNEDQIIKEVVKGEKEAVKHYKQILNDDYLPMSSKLLLREQITSVEKSLGNAIVMESLS
ncbi:ferritin-like domain-containing protein [Aquimarina agarivorans]|uniref:ferritin-like domain-containing protein n=1 Tax=Aquimarina agarivorans TaxID=980584 RepID=UPI000248F2D7|nr:PA2169 family four-helix-bundle protein [Aquimarina agarivorans]